jgi:hypothetical protein
MQLLNSHSTRARKQSATSCTNAVCCHRKHTVIALEIVHTSWLAFLSQFAASALKGSSPQLKACTQQQQQQQQQQQGILAENQYATTHN